MGSPQLIALASLLEYPAADFRCRLRDARHVLDLPPADAAADAPAGTAHAARALAAFDRFADTLSAAAPETREEWFTATFDVTPACVLHVSIHLFGEENYKRGQFMARLLARYHEVGFRHGGELPDHLAVLLRYAAQADPAERRELVEFCLLGPVGAMIAGLPEDHPYRPLLDTVREVLRAGVPGLEPAPVASAARLAAHGCGAATAACGCGAIEAEPELAAAPGGAAFNID
jgi:nitrate reductase delta subunit